MENKELLKNLFGCVMDSCLILSDSGTLLHCSGKLSFQTEQIKAIQKMSDIESGVSESEWEYFDQSEKKYYKVHSQKCSIDQGVFYVHNLTDITEYLDLYKEIGQYSVFYKKLSEFQKVMMEKMSEKYYKIVSVFAELFQSDITEIIWTRTPEEAVRIHYESENYQISYIRTPSEIEQLLKIQVGAVLDGMQCQCTGEINAHNYVVLADSSDKEVMKMYLDIVKAYLENAIIRESIVYESEHDAMTGLYNKGKYLSRLKDKYPNLDSIAIFNFDVNNLKKMNDLYGHEMGDRLLIKAAESIRNITTETIHGYRLGGDEYLMVACNPKEEDVAVIQKQWEQELALLNQRQDGIECVVAVGTAYGKAPYNLSELLKKADEAMYEDKKRKKKPGEEIR